MLHRIAVATGAADQRCARAYLALKTYLGAGFPLRSAFESVDWRGVLTPEGARSIREALGAGESFSETLERTKALNAVDRACVSAGETSGHLPEVLEDLARGHEEVALVRQGILNRLLYPVFLLHVAAFVLSLSAYFQSGGSSYLAEVFRTLVFFYALGAVGTWVFCWLPRGPLAGAFFKVPLVGRFARDLALAGFARAFRHLYEAGVELVRGFRLASEATPNSWLRRRLFKGLGPLEAREPLLAAVRRTGLFKEAELGILATGEATGTLGESFRRLERWLQERGGEGMKKSAFLLTHAIHLGNENDAAKLCDGFLDPGKMTVGGFRAGPVLFDGGLEIVQRAHQPDERRPVRGPRLADGHAHLRTFPRRARGPDLGSRGKARTGCCGPAN